MSQLTVSVVIPTRNAGAVFEQVLERLSRQEYGHRPELVVVDSGSTDGTVDLARRYGARVECVEPASFNHGLTRNRGIELSTGEVVVLLTQDAVPADVHMVSALAAPYASPRVGGCYGRQIPRADHDVLVRRNVNNHLTGGTRLVSREVTADQYEQLSPVERYVSCNFDNVCSSLRRSAWEQIPFPDSQFGEDLAWSKRALHAGWQIVYQPAAAVIHSHARSALYEYRRTYMCHRKLYELFGVATVPEWRYVPRNVMEATVADWRYVLREEKRPRERLRLLARVPALAVASVLGQYSGARDERLGRGRSQRDV